jgi:DhnA family fructose-bisphosphate aldolase class Ia
MPRTATVKVEDRIDAAIEQLVDADVYVSSSADEKHREGFAAIVSVSKKVEVVVVLFRFPDSDHFAVVYDAEAKWARLAPCLEDAVKATADPASFRWSRDDRMFGFELGVIGYDRV